MGSALFSPFDVRGLRLSNRIAMSPMLMYIADGDGLVNDVHVAHYGARMIGGVGLVMSEVVAVVPEGRISRQDIGLWHDGQIEGIARLAAMAQATGTAFGVQLAHAGRKSQAQERGVAPSALPYGELAPPRALAGEELPEVVAAYAAAARRAVAAGVDCLEVHAGHGYLLHEFLSPLANQRTDSYGGDLGGRSRLVLEVVAAVRAEMPETMPLFVRVPATDIASGGLDEREGLVIAEHAVLAGADVLDVSTGNIRPGYDADVYPGYQARYAAQFGGLDCAVATFGSVTDPGLAEYLVSSGMTDLVFLGRALLRDPFWAMHAARAAGVDATLPIPTYARATGPYERGF